LGFTRARTSASAQSALASDIGAKKQNQMIE
jgi:hypothetical protein